MRLHVDCQPGGIARRDCRSEVALEQEIGLQNLKPSPIEVGPEFRVDTSLMQWASWEERSQAVRLLRGLTILVLPPNPTGTPWLRSPGWRGC